MSYTFTDHAYTFTDHAKWMSAARKLIRREIKRYNIHPRVLAARAGIGYVTTINFIDGTTFIPNVRTVNALKAALGYPITNLDGTVVVPAKRGFRGVING